MMYSLSEFQIFIAIMLSVGTPIAALGAFYALVNWRLKTLERMLSRNGLLAHVEAHAKWIDAQTVLCQARHQDSNVVNRLEVNTSVSGTGD